MGAWIRAGLGVLLLAVVALPARAGSVDDAAPAGGARGGVRGFDVFCASWMQKLRDREAYNTGRISWQKDGGGVFGEYTGYSDEHTCVAHEDPGKEPIGRITYRELRYRRQGTTPDEALAQPGTIVERFDVTEIFRYAKGRWQY
jgi:hypothetical protein